MLHFDNVSYLYPGTKGNTLSHVSLSLEQPGVYGLLGPNGAGKSTLLYLACGLLFPTEGTVSAFGEPSRLRKPSTMANIMLVPEEIDVPNTTVEEYARHMSKFYPRFSMDNLCQNLETFGIEADRQMTGMSMGEKKKAYMSVAMAANTPLMLLDEPTNGLDIPGKASFRRFIASNMCDDRIMVISTHQVHDIENLLDHVLIMREHGFVLNASLDEVTRKLEFGQSADPEVVKSALYAAPGLTGASIVRINATEVDSTVNLETLFMLAMEKPQELKAIFHQDKV